jgi:hypothetical protein
LKAPAAKVSKPTKEPVNKSAAKATAAKATAAKASPAKASNYPSVWIGNSIRIRPDDLRTFLDRQTVSGA